jgi:hypothetical protein
VDTALGPNGQVQIDELDPRMLRESRPATALRTEDASVIRYALHARTVEATQQHKVIMNTLNGLARAKHFKTTVGAHGSYQYDALIRNYHRGRDLLLEVKATVDQAAARLAVGQLLDYRRHLARVRTTDLAVVLPFKPPRSVRELLDHVGVQLGWLDGRRLTGPGPFVRLLR